MVIRNTVDYRLDFKFNNAITVKSNDRIETFSAQPFLIRGRQRAY
jgi:hypothetical protein